MTQYICETLEENVALKIRVAELLQRCDILNYELEQAKDRAELAGTELYQRRAAS